MSDSSSQPDDVQNDEVIGRALKISFIVILFAVVSIACFFAVRWLAGPDEEQNVETELTLPKVREVAEAQVPRLPLVDVTSEIGIDWKHESGREGEKLLPETMGGGVAVLDYDCDGDQDLLLVGGKSWSWAKQPNPDPRSLCLYENDGTGRFIDVTKQAGLDIPLYAMGPVIGDYDNDGWPDIYVTAVGQDRLFHNDQGQFSEVSQQAGLVPDQDPDPNSIAAYDWSTGGVWFDYDRDGLLDLFVCRYVVWTRELDITLGSSLTGIGRAYGQPTSFTGTQSQLYRNLGGGRFEDVSEAMGIHVQNPNTGVPVGKGLAVAAMDIDQDGWQDLIVANDTVRNFLFLNAQGQQFSEMGVAMGVALDRSGNATGAMGLDCCYLRNNDDLAVAIGNFANEPTSLFISRGPMTAFTDRAMTTGLGPMSRLNLTFGVVFGDLDLDSRMDLVCANGHLEEEIAKVQSTQQYAQPPQFFWNAGQRGSSEFVALSAEQVGEAALQRLVGRGVAHGDLDGDGDLDIVLVANGGHPRVLRNDQELGNHWLRLTLQGTKSNRDAIGAQVRVSVQEQTLRQVVVSARSYLSQCESTLTFGLANHTQINGIEVTWPSGDVEDFDALPVDATHLLVEGSGRPVK